MIYEINYASKEFESAQNYHVREAKKRGKFDHIIAYTPQSLDPEYLKTYGSKLLRPRGGMWVWKSHIINYTLKMIEEGDYLFYSDAGACIRKPVTKFISVMEKNHDEIMCFEIYGRKEIQYTKADVFHFFNVLDEKVLYTNQIMGGFLLIKKTESTVKIFEEFENICLMENLLEGNENQSGRINFNEFITHRHDQSILSVLLKSHNITPYRDPSQWGLYQYVKFKQGLLQTEELNTYIKSTFPLWMVFLHRMGKADCTNLKGLVIIAIKKLDVWKNFMKYWFDKKKEI